MTHYQQLSILQIIQIQQFLLIAYYNMTAILHAMLTIALALIARIQSPLLLGDE